MSIKFSNLNPNSAPNLREYLNGIINKIEQYRDFDTIDIHISKFGANHYCGKIDINDHNMLDNEKDSI